MPRSRVQRESDKAKDEDHPVEKEHVEHEHHQVTLDHDHRDHLGVDHREGPVDPPEPTDHLTGYPDAEPPEEPPDAAEPPQEVDNRTRDQQQVPINPEDHEA